MKEDSGCRKRFRNGGSYGRADFTGRRAYGARGGQGDPARGRAYDKKRRDACADGTERCGKVDTGVCSDRQSQIQRHRGKNPFQGK